MACKLISINNTPNVSEKREYLCDKEDEIALLPKYNIKGRILDDEDSVCDNPCSIGSMAFVCETSNIYILSPSNEWVKL